MLRILCGVALFSGALAFTSPAFAIDRGIVAARGAPAVSNGGIGGSAIAGRLPPGAIGGPADSRDAGPRIGGTAKPPLRR